MSAVVARRFAVPALALAVLVSAPPVLAAPGTGTLYGTDAAGGNLITINPNTGQSTVVGPTGVGSLPSLAVHPASGVIYAGGGGGSPRLYRLNPLHGSATLVGDTGLGLASIGALEFSSTGVLYASVNLAGNGNTGSDHLAIIDPSDASTTIVGPFGACSGVSVPTSGSGSCTLEGIEGLAFDAAGRLWGSLSDRGAAGAPGLYLIDPATGQATFAHALADGAGNPPSGGVVSLQATCDGKLLGGTARARPGFSDGGNLIEINPADGSFVTKGNAVPNSSLGALSYTDHCQPTPVQDHSWGRVKSIYR